MSDKHKALFDDINRTIFSIKLTAACEDSELTKKKFAESIGVTPQMISQYFSGKCVPSIFTLASMAKAIGVTTDYLLGLTDCESTDPNIRSISDYTGLTIDSIENMKKYKSVPLFMDVVNFLFTHLDFLEAIADFLTTPLLDDFKNQTYSHVNFALPVDDKLSGLRALALHDTAVSAQKIFAEENSINTRLREYVEDRFVAQYSTNSNSCKYPQSANVYNAYDILNSLNERHTRTQFEDYVQTLEYFAISDVDHARAVRRVRESLAKVKPTTSINENTEN